MNAAFLGLLLGFLKSLAALWTLSRICEAMRPAGILVFAVFLSLLIYPGNLPGPDALLSGAKVTLPDVIRLSLLSLFSGMLVAWPLAVLLETLPMAARFVDVLRGSQHAEQLLPGLESRSSALESAAAAGVCLVYFGFGGYQLLVLGLIQPSMRQDASSLGVSPGEVELLTELFGLSLRSLLKLALPVATVLLLFDCGSALISRFAAKLPIGSEFPSIRLILGLSAFAISIESSLLGVLADLLAKIQEVFIS